jgi:hypothetical protein
MGKHNFGDDTNRPVQHKSPVSERHLANYPSLEGLQFTKDIEVTVWR